MVLFPPPRADNVSHMGDNAATIDTSTTEKSLMIVCLCPGLRLSERTFLHDAWGIGGPMRPRRRHRFDCVLYSSCGVLRLRPKSKSGGWLGRVVSVLPVGALIEAFA